MAYNELDDTLISIGEPTKKEIFQTIKDNQESFNTDIEALKQTSTVQVFDVKFSGNFSDYSDSELEQFYPVFRAPVAFTMTSFVMTLIDDALGVGILSVQIDKSTDNGINWTPLLTGDGVQISTSNLGDTNSSVNWVDAASQDVAQNDLLRLRFVTFKALQPDFHISVYAEVSGGA